MPSKPPSLRAKRPGPARVLSNWDKRKTRQQRGYGRQHELIRQQLLRDEPLCRPCREAGRVTLAKIADHVIPKAEGGTDDRDNYQPSCVPCHTAKTARESARARRRS